MAGHGHSPEGSATIDHLSITVNDLGAAERFYDAVMTALDYPKVKASDTSVDYGIRRTAEIDEGAYISMIKAEGVVADRRHWAFSAPDRASVDRFHDAALRAGGTDDGAPGLRPDYHPHYYGAFVLDPDGNRIEAVCRRRS